METQQTTKKTINYKKTIKNSDTTTPAYRKVQQSTNIQFLMEKLQHKR